MQGAVPDEETGARQLIEDLAGVLQPGRHPSEVRSHGVVDAGGHQEMLARFGLVGGHHDHHTSRTRRVAMTGPHFPDHGSGPWDPSD